MLTVWLRLWTDGCSHVRERCSSNPSSLNSFQMSWDACSSTCAHVHYCPFVAKGSHSYRLICLLTAPCLDDSPVFLARLERVLARCSVDGHWGILQHISHVIKEWKETVPDATQFSQFWGPVQVEWERGQQGGQANALLPFQCRDCEIARDQSHLFIHSFQFCLLSPYCMLASHSISQGGLNCVPCPQFTC